MATATGSRQPRRRNGDQLRREPKARNCQTKEILPPNCKSVQKNKNNSGLQSPFLLTRLVHFQAAIWHNLSPLLTQSNAGQGEAARVRQNSRLHGLVNLVSGSACNQCSDLALPKPPSRTI